MKIVNRLLGENTKDDTKQKDKTLEKLIHDNNNFSNKCYQIPAGVYTLFASSIMLHDIFTCSIQERTYALAGLSLLVVALLEHVSINVREYGKSLISSLYENQRNKTQDN